jgi:hypothetical protein
MTIMAKLDRLKEEISFGDKDFYVHELPNKKLKQLFKSLEKTLKGVLATEVEGVPATERADGWFDVAGKLFGDLPYDIVQQIVPEASTDDIDDATPREVVHAFKMFAKVNGVDFEQMVELLKKGTPLLKQGLQQLTNRLQEAQQPKQ